MSLAELAHAAGIDAAYTNFRGEPTHASDESVLAALRALSRDLGIHVGGPADAPAAIAAIERARWAEIVPPVVIGFGGVIVVPFSVPANTDGPWEIEVTTEAGNTFAQRGLLFDLPADSHASPDGVMHCVRRATIALGASEFGYHTVAWRCAGAQGEAFAIAAQEKAWGAPGEGGRRWGVFAPLYGLASTASGQCGDLGSMRRLCDAVARRGGKYVATLPMLAAFLDEPCHFSPYSPASRLYWNELYLDLAPLAAMVGVPAPSAPPIVPDTLIDYQTQYHWRRHAIDPIARALLADPQRGGEIDAWATANGAYDYAAFRAIGEAQRAGWSDWPSLLRDAPPSVTTRADAIAFGVDGAHVNTHVVAQWAMQQQLEALAKHEVQLYVDLPVGVNCDAYEVWRHRGLFLTPLAAGAPPDTLFLGGQNWGLPPLSPIALRRDRYRYFIRCIRHHMKVAGMLRIDHVMGLFRLYCVPEGHPATDGVYLRYPSDELLAIVVLESHRNQCAVAGEDLGTVPPHVRPAMKRHGMFRLHVGQWFFPSKPGDAPAPSPHEAIASLNTHDTATFAGWWRGGDIDDRKDLGLITDAQDIAERRERDQQKRALLTFAHATPDDHLAEVERAMVAATTDLATGPAEVMLIALDDLALEPTPHNVPGTSSERTNWQRRVPGWADALDEDRASPASRAAVLEVVLARPRT
ncbi:MAG: 4-alpha-glucanotransferase [Myxococcota bacterium]|nr:4-alpha-glucanotransferase [Myxococcota bacterium]